MYSNTYFQCGEEGGNYGGDLEELPGRRGRQDLGYQVHVQLEEWETPGEGGEACFSCQVLGAFNDCWRGIVAMALQILQYLHKDCSDG